MASYKFKIYLIEKNQSSKELLHKVTSILNNRFRNNYSLEIVDILKNPEIAINDNILATPTLLKEYPLPARRIIGDITDEKSFLSILSLS